ncbi:MAG: hypothetical protein IKT41_00565 [Clostridia bacterium]|nr:hypothetical protein [Clostridia bacterium]
MKITYKIILITFLSLLILSSTILAVDKLDLEINVSQEEIKIGDKFTVTVDWRERNASSRF